MATSLLINPADGQPFTLPDLAEPQTLSDAKLAQLRRHYASHPTSGLTPGRIATILREAEHGNLVAQCDLAESMEEKDTHIQSELNKRRLAWHGPDWNLAPPANASAEEKRDTEMIEALLRDATWLDDAIYDCGDAILKGFANLELQWRYDDRTHYVSGAQWQDPAWFQAHPEQRNELRLRDGSHEGAALRPFGWLSHRVKSKSGYLSRIGLARVVVWPFLFKNYSVRDLAEFLEIYGLPVRLGKYPEGSSEKEKATLLRAVLSIGHNAGGIIPKGMDIDFQTAAAGSADPFMAMVSWAEKSQSKSILGGTLTSQADGKTSTNALGNVHNEVRQEIRDADLRALGNTLTRDLVYPLFALNGKSYRSPRRCPRFVFDLTEPEDLGQLGNGLKAFVDMGLAVPVSWVREKTRIPEPNGNEPVLQAANTLAANPPGAIPPANSPAEKDNAVPLTALKTAAGTEVKEQWLNAFPDQHTVERALDQLSAGDLNDDMAALLVPLFTKASEGPAALKAELASLWPQLDDSALTQRLAQVLFVGELWGMANG